MGAGDRLTLTINILKVGEKGPPLAQNVSTSAGTGIFPSRHGSSADTGPILHDPRCAREAPACSRAGTEQNVYPIRQGYSRNRGAFRRFPVGTLGVVFSRNEGNGWGAAYNGSSQIEVVRCKVLLIGDLDLACGQTTS